ncbi:major facilitator superfamily protein, putative [Ichthyophthirius multifiliis]|uniref:Major facilitator superfamily protein, putative n=1 Tax=Ichthyophthirius multifiliis TaxID=5932 RepID=G0QS53_ICHMU|nr:major facilitator superfamily protein, putative [Ichthyophthirius multifiliis]EGR31918.1 major facilitator superfamily protein, putative [Ichthyophthirius multifiliis]|eukprot:XP_004035404.1 major facilitator superfamily protein, putative [Ichthyophthirius multifiliis]
MSDKYGRKRTMIWASILQFIAGFFSVFSQNYYQFLILRCLFGFSNGLVSPLTSCYTTEIVPESKRGKFFIHLNNIFALGEIVVILLAILFLDNLEEGNWRALLFCTSMPALAALYFSFKYLIESPRYRLCCTNNKLYQVFQELNHMGYLNNANFLELKDIEKEQLLVWGEASYQRQKDKIGSIRELFKGEDLPITLNLMVMWFSISFVYYGVMLMLPIILIQYNDKNELDYSFVQFLGIFLSSFVEFPSNLAAYFTIDNPKYGRKKSMFYSYLLCSLLCFIVFLTQTDAEVYITALRTTGLGLNSAVSRIGGILMPWISFYFFKFGNAGPFLGFSIVSGLSALCTYIIKFDTSNSKF